MTEQQQSLLISGEALYCSNDVGERHIRHEHGRDSQKARQEECRCRLGLFAHECVFLHAAIRTEQRAEIVSRLCLFAGIKTDRELH
jgi:hypothetical protein